MSAPRAEDLLAGVAVGDVQRLAAGEHHDPHRVLGAHPARVRGRDGVVVRAFHPDAREAALLPEGEGGSPLAMHELGRGLFAAFLPGAAFPLRYRLRFGFEGSGVWERDDPYRFPPTVSDYDVHLFGEGTHRRLWEMLGASPCVHEGVAGTAFAVWAPNARRASVVGEFCGWDGRLFPMRGLGGSGIFELFVPDVGPGTLYKFELLTREGALRLKTDPFARAMETPPGTASRVAAYEHVWGDDAWLARREKADPRREPLSLYEVHLGSWLHEEGRLLSYREIAPRLAAHAKRLGFTHLELLPVSEHPFTGSWGYQVSGYYAPTARFGTPDDFRFFVDHCHQEGLGVLIDWVPAHFPKDDWALRRFDGSALFEHEDPRRAEHPDWGTLIFNYGRNEVRNFLTANALYWLREFHVDGLRVDAVASMLYLDYSRKAGEWLPNRYGGRENLEAIDFLRETNRLVAEEVPGAIMAAEESTAFPGVTQPLSAGGLGFTFKWNMGWMHDTLEYFAKDPVYRAHHHDMLSFAMVYEYSERFVNPISHDEVVHGKRSLLEKMPGDAWQKFANLRALLAYQFTRPGKQLLFMGTELAPHLEWNHDHGLDWSLAEDERRRGLGRFLEDLGRLYRESPCLWRSDPDPAGFEWVDAGDRERSIYSFVRRHEGEHLLVVMNLTPQPYDDYRIGAPQPGHYRLRLCSDAARYAGSGYPVHEEATAEPEPWHGRAHSLRLRLPPLGVLVMAPEGS